MIQQLLWEWYPTNFITKTQFAYLQDIQSLILTKIHSKHTRQMQWNFEGFSFYGNTQKPMVLWFNPSFEVALSPRVFIILSVRGEESIYGSKEGYFIGFHPIFEAFFEDGVSAGFLFDEVDSSFKTFVYILSKLFTSDHFYCSSDHVVSVFIVSTLHSIHFSGLL